MAKLNLLDLAQRKGSDAAVGLIEEVSTVAPEFTTIPARPKTGTSYKVTRRTGLPAVGFRNVNEGVGSSKSTLTSELKPMYFFDALIEVDEAVVKGDDTDLPDMLADESAAVVRSMGLLMGSQVYSGTSAGNKGFNGFDAQISAGANYFISAGGSGVCATAWLAWLDPNYQGVHFVVGNEGEFDLKPWRTQYVADPADSAKRLMVHITNMSFYVGLAVNSVDSLFRITKINTANPLTDALGNQLLAKVPLTRRAGLMWFMNRNCQYLLQNSRYTVGAGVGILYPDLPTSLAGIPITITDSLVDAA